MKKIMLLIVIFTFSLFSCSESDDSEITQSIIVGKWHPISLQKNGKSIPLSTCEMSSSLEFFANDTYLDTFAKNNGTSCVERIVNGSFSLKDNLLLLKEIGANYTYNKHSYVEFITPTKFTFKIYQLQEGSNSNYISESDQATITFEKVK